MINEGDLILLYSSHNRQFLIPVKDKFHTDKGFVDLTEIIGKEYGCKIKTNLGDEFFVLCPTLFDLTMKVNRKTQIIYPKDIGIILTKGTIFPGAKIIETGTGSASLTSAMANFVRPNGCVYTYEQREDLYKNAVKNIKKNGFEQWVKMHNQEIIDEFPQKDADFVMIDMGSPWKLIPAAYKALKPGCRMATICPSFEQLTKTVYTMEEIGFTNIESLEVLLRHILVRPNKTRPEQQIPSHTGFLVFATKILLDS